MTSSSHPATGPTVTTSAGVVEGQNEGGLRVFKGEPPEGRQFHFVTVGDLHRDDVVPAIGHA